MPTAGPSRSPLDAASTTSVPMIGPVQEKDTNAKLKAIKNTPSNPPRSDCASILLTEALGKVSSNAPKKKAAKITKNRKNRKLKMPLVYNLLSASDPKVMEMSIPNATYITMINNPYTSACDIAFALEPPFLVKKLTVSGTMGNIQGMIKAAKPPSKPAIKMPQRDCFSVPLASACWTGASVASLSDRKS